MPLGVAGDPVFQGQTGVEPLRGIRRRHLVDQHMRAFVLESLRIPGAIEIPFLFAPMPPTSRQPFHHLAYRGLRAGHGIPVGIEDGPSRGIEPGNVPPADVFLGQDIHRRLGPCRRGLDREDFIGRSARPAAEDRRPYLKTDRSERIFSRLGELPGELHAIPLSVRGFGMKRDLWIWRRKGRAKRAKAEQGD
jgi:hypothetical protein